MNRSSGPVKSDNELYLSMALRSSELPVVKQKQIQRL